MPKGIVGSEGIVGPQLFADDAKGIVGDLLCTGAQGRVFVQGGAADGVAHVHGNGGLAG